VSLTLPACGTGAGIERANSVDPMQLASDVGPVPNQVFALGCIDHVLPFHTSTRVLVKDSFTARSSPTATHLLVYKHGTLKSFAGVCLATGGARSDSLAGKRDCVEGRSEPCDARLELFC